MSRPKKRPKTGSSANGDAFRMIWVDEMLVTALTARSAIPVRSGRPGWTGLPGRSWPGVWGDGVDCAAEASSADRIRPATRIPAKNAGITTKRRRSKRLVMDGPFYWTVIFLAGGGVTFGSEIVSTP